jgi:hypothetical protein
VLRTPCTRPPFWRGMPQSPSWPRLSLPSPAWSGLFGSIVCWSSGNGFDIHSRAIRCVLVSTSGWVKGGGRTLLDNLRRLPLCLHHSLSATISRRFSRHGASVLQLGVWGRTSSRVWMPAEFCADCCLRQHCFPSKPGASGRCPPTPSQPSIPSCERSFLIARRTVTNDVPRGQVVVSSELQLRTLKIVVLPSVVMRCRLSQGGCSRSGICTTCRQR